MFGRVGAHSRASVSSSSDLLARAVLIKGLDSDKVGLGDVSRSLPRGAAFGSSSVSAGSLLSKIFRHSDYTFYMGVIMLWDTSSIPLHSREKLGCIYSDGEFSESCLADLVREMWR